jgi:hypothetical protein
MRRQLAKICTNSLRTVFESERSAKAGSSIPVGAESVRGYCNEKFGAVLDEWVVTGTFWLDIQA